MTINQFKHVWVRHAAVALAYALAYALMRPYSDLAWTLPAGMRLSCLMLVPYRYWPALAIGEFFPLAYFCYPHMEQWGVAFFVTASIPPILFAMPIVWWCREHVGLFPTKRHVGLKALAICIGSVSIIWMLVSAAPVATVTVQSDAPGYRITAAMMAGFLLGKYIGILIFVPLALLAKLEHRTTAWRVRFNELSESRLMMDSLLLLIPTLLFLGWVSNRSDEDVRQVLRMAMFLPVAWMTLKHGWRATALGGPLVVFCISMTLISNSSEDRIQMQSFVAFAMTCLFALGARITVQNERTQKIAIDGERALQLAQESMHFSELRMRQNAQMLEQVFGGLHLTHATLLDRFRPMLPTSEGQRYYVQAALAQNQIYRLVDAMHPSAWREHGLAAALHQTIGRTLDEMDISYRCEVKGPALENLAPSLHTAVYRLVCETLVYLSNQQPCSNVRVSVRTGYTHRRRWVTFRVECSWDKNELASEKSGTNLSANLAGKLGASGMTLGNLKDHARLYNGQLHMRAGVSKLRITSLLHDSSDVAAPVREQQSTPAHRQLYIC